MATYVDSASTYAEVEAAYDDASQYDVIGSVILCRQFIVAGRILLRRIAERSESGTAKVQKNVVVIESSITRAQSWLVANDDAVLSPSGSSYVLRFSLEEFRG